MRVVIESHSSDGKEYFEFTLNDGPMGRERIRGYASDLTTAFCKIAEWRERIARDSNELPGGEDSYDETG